MKIKRTERGWAGHFICANRCRFRRNTLLEKIGTDIKIVVSTVGLMERDPSDKINKGDFVQVGCDRYYETMAFRALAKDHRYHDIDVQQQVFFDSPWCLNEIDADDLANDMHEQVVAELIKELESGTKYEKKVEPVAKADLIAKVALMQIASARGRFGTGFPFDIAQKALAKMESLEKENSK